MLVFNMIPNIIIHLQNLFYSLGSFIPDDKVSHNCFQFFIPSLIPSQRCVAEKFIRTTQHLRCGKEDCARVHHSPPTTEHERIDEILRERERRKVI
jgi:hypothetical protein